MDVNPTAQVAPSTEASGNRYWSWNTPGGFPSLGKGGGDSPSLGKRGVEKARGSSQESIGQRPTPARRRRLDVLQGIRLQERQERQGHRHRVPEEPWHGRPGEGQADGDKD